ncbi:phasin [Novosphingobium sp. AAP83]|uniref:phasin family protein n=1 Tax=Novosphingobium sp. AAP83 TaxID=1523425 RepID=UPI0006B91951|nr:phasin family protein [Novosphingobium sp. AAP83]KPF92427.1 phasin [Novosphingobium sp. AAP83]
MIDKVMDSADETTPAVDTVDAVPEVIVIETTALAEPAPARKPAKRGAAKTSKVKAKAIALSEVPTEPVAVIAKTPAKTLPKAPPVKLPKTAATAAVPAVKPASKRPSTAIPRAKTPSVTTFAGSANASATRKELFAMVTTPAEFTDKMQTAFKDAQEKAKTAFGEAGTFAKGNVEAIVESSKILATGLQDMTKGYVEETKTSFEAMTADVKELAAVKSPTEFFEKQSALMRKTFDAAVATSSKNSETMLKLVNEAFQPISTRVSLAVEKIKTAA